MASIGNNLLIRPVRCFFSTRERLQRSGVVADVCLEIVLQTGNHELVVARLNNMRIQTNRDSGELFLGSDRKEIIRKDGDRQVVTGQIYYVQFLPANKFDDAEGDAAQELQRKVMKQFLAECKQFVKVKKEQLHDSQSESFNIPPDIEDVLEEDRRDKQNDSDNKWGRSNIPF
jgi:hypothetical protein